MSRLHDYTRCAPKSLKEKKHEDNTLVSELTLIWFLDFGQFAERGLCTFIFKDVVGLTHTSK